MERTLGLPRSLGDIDGLKAITLWYRYENSGDQDALRLLLDYNRQDVLNLRALKQALEAQDLW